MQTKNLVVSSSVESVDVIVIWNINSACGIHQGLTYVETAGDMGMIEQY